MSIRYSEDKYSCLINISKFERVLADSLARNPKICLDAETRVLRIVRQILTQKLDEVRG